MRGLALEGGGAKGAYQAGAIKALLKKGIKFDGVAGTSIGAINAAFLASNNVEAMYRLWESTDSKEIFGVESSLLEAIKNNTLTKDMLLKGLDSVTKIIKNKGIDTKNIRKILTNNLSESKIRKNTMDYGLITFNISDLKPIEIWKKDIPDGKLVDYIIASAYLPCFKFEKIIDNKYYFDGGIYSNCPVDSFIHKKYDEVYAIKAWEGKRLRYDHSKGTKVIVIGSNEKLGSIFDFSPKTGKKKMKMGYYDTLRVLDHLDGKEYYFKKYCEKYYTSLFEPQMLKKMIKKFSNTFLVTNNKSFIINIIENVCEELKIEQYSIYNMPFLITKLKYLMLANKKSVYYEFISEIKVKFE